VVRDHKIRPDTRLAGSVTLSDKWEFTETNKVVDFRALIRGFRMSALCRRAGTGAGPASESLVRRKARGGRGAVWLGASYGDLKVADGSRVGLRGREALTLIDGNVGEERVRSRAYEGLA
jgi:hypothetical protein